MRITISVPSLLRSSDGNEQGEEDLPEHTVMAGLTTTGMLDACW